MAAATQTGTVKWFNDAKGFGFITPDSVEQDSGDDSGEQNEPQDVFIHHSAVVGEGFCALAEHSRVEFETRETEKGIEALNLVVIG